MLLRHFNPKSITERFDIVCIVFIYIVTGMEIYYLRWRNAFYSMTKY